MRDYVVRLFEVSCAYSSRLTDFGFLVTDKVLSYGLRYQPLMH